jgi:hypothetical protein
MTILEGVVRIVLNSLCERKNISSHTIVKYPWNWTPGKVKARKYTMSKKEVQHETTTNIYRGVQNAGDLDLLNRAHTTAELCRQHQLNGSS